MDFEHEFSEFPHRSESARGTLEENARRRRPGRWLGVSLKIEGTWIWGQSKNGVIEWRLVREKPRTTSVSYVFGFRHHSTSRYVDTMILLAAFQNQSVPTWPFLPLEGDVHRRTDRGLFVDFQYAEYSIRTMLILDAISCRIVCEFFLNHNQQVFLKSTRTIFIPPCCLCLIFLHMLTAGLHTFHLSDKFSLHITPLSLVATTKTKAMCMQCVCQLLIKISHLFIA